jgi:hypothetical protein
MGEWPKQSFEQQQSARLNGIPSRDIFSPSMYLRADSVLFLLGFYYRIRQAPWSIQQTSQRATFRGTVTKLLAPTSSLCLIYLVVSKMSFA